MSEAYLDKKSRSAKGLICDIEKGRRTASVDLAAKISKIMGYSKESMIKQIFEDQLKNVKIKLKVKLETA